MNERVTWDGAASIRSRSSISHGKVPIVLAHGDVVSVAWNSLASNFERHDAERAAGLSWMQRRIKGCLDPEFIERLQKTGDVKFDRGSVSVEVAKWLTVQARFAEAANFGAQDDDAFVVRKICGAVELSQKQRRAAGLTKDRSPLAGHRHETRSKIRVRLISRRGMERVIPGSAEVNSVR